MPIQYLTDWSGAPADLPTQTLASVGDIPTELVVRIPRACFKSGASQTRVDGYLNRYMLQAGAVSGPNQTLNVRIAGCTIAAFDQLLPAATRNITHTSSGTVIGTIVLHRDTGQNYFWLQVYVGGLASDTYYNAVTGDTEIVVENAARINDCSYQLGHFLGGRGQLYLRPMSSTPSSTVFVDNVGYSGMANFYKTFQYSSGVTTGTWDFCIGFIKRSALGKNVQDITVGDVVFGALVHGANADVIVNGASIWGRSNLPNAAKLEIMIDTQPTADLSHPTSAQLASIQHEVRGSGVYICGNAADYGTITPLPNGTLLDIDFANAVYVDYSALSTTAADGYYGGQTVLASYYDSEPMYGLSFAGDGEVIFRDDMIGGTTLPGTTAETGQLWAPYPDGDTRFTMDGSGTYCLAGGAYTDNEFVFPEGPFSIEFTVLGSTATSSASQWFAGIGGAFVTGAANMSGGYRFRFPGSTQPIVFDQFAADGSWTSISTGIVRTAGGQWRIELAYTDDSVSLYVDGLLVYGPASIAAPLTGKAMRLIGGRAGSGMTQVCWIKDLSVVSYPVPPVPPFWTDFELTVETI